MISYPIMKEVLKALADAYALILTGNIELDGSPLPVYNGMAPSTELGSYILVGERGSQQRANKCTYMWDANILVDCVIKNGNFGYEDSDSVRGQVGELINTRLNPSLAPDFQVISTTANPFNLSGMNPTEPVFRSLIRFEHIISQL